MEFTVKIYGENSIIEKRVEGGTNLLDFLQKNRIDINPHCNGNRKCGKCKVRVSGLKSLPDEKERELLGHEARAKGYRLACFNEIDSDIEIYLEELKGQAVISTEGLDSSFKIEPIISKCHVSLDLPGINDQRSLFDRILSVSEGYRTDNLIDNIRDLPGVLYGNNFDVTLVCMKKKLIAVEPGNTTSKIFGAAFDIGTTTIAGYLVDLLTGNKICTAAILNPQRIFGSDVISRIKHAGGSVDSMNEMNRIIIDCINDIIYIFTVESGIDQNSIYMASFVGNTTMMHFLMNIPANGMAVSPFIPVTTSAHKFRAGEMGIKINEKGYVLILPSVSAYVGADTVAAVLSSRMYNSKKVSLLIDIGTNGEIVLGNSKWLYSCSAAAGPAFEGANIRNGIGGIEGAIDKVSFKPEFKINTIGNKAAVGICGSGVIDIVAGMIENGICDRSGRILDPNVINGLDPGLKSRVKEIEGMRVFLLLKSEDCAADSDIVITQRDIREIQNAKAAIAAGIRVLAKKAGINTCDIERVYLAGSFGSFMNIDNALKIGLLPEELKGKIVSAGNAAGIGAVQCLLSSRSLDRADEIKKRIEYVELSASEEFMAQYIECMGF